MKKLMIIGASVLQLPAILKAKELGYYVGVVDYNPEAVGIKYADEFFEVSTIDIDRVAETAKKFNPDGIMTLATDMPMRSVAKAAEICGLPGISMDTAIKATDKGEMIKAFQAHGVEHPWYYIALNSDEFKAVKDKIKYPCIMKPTDNAGSRGVVLIHNTEELESNYQYAVNESRNGGVIIEEYLIGPEVSVEVIVVNGNPVVLQITDKITTGAPHFVEMGHTQPSRLSKEDQEKISDLAIRAVKAVGINCGPAHVEIMLTSNGPKMVELGARMGGDCITSHLVPLSTGIDMVRATIEIACGMEPDITPKLKKGSAIRFFRTDKGILEEISGIESAKEIDGVREITFTKKIGDSVGNINSSIDRVGFLIVQADSADDADRISQVAVNKIKFSIN